MDSRRNGMTTLRERNALLVYFVIACVPPWIGWSLVVFGFIPEGSPFSGPIFLTGESVSVAGLFGTFCAQGRAGVVRLLRVAFQVKVPVHWWLFAFLVPLLSISSAGVLYLTPQPASSFQTLGSSTAWHTRALDTVSFRSSRGRIWMAWLLVASICRTILGGARMLFRGYPLGPLALATFLQGHSQIAGGGTLLLLANVISLSFLVGTVYLRTNSLVLAMIAHWSSNAAQTLVGVMLPGLPGDILNVTSFKWCVVVALGVAAAITIPLLRVGVPYGTSPQRKYARSVC